jgi:UDP-N-acetylglucosamine 1-carboxyvinyltransferase
MTTTETPLPSETQTSLGERLVVSAPLPPCGEVTVSGAKNSVLKLMAASLLSDEAVQLTNVPNLSDVRVMQQVIGQLGRSSTFDGDHVLTIDGGEVHSIEAPYELVSQMRASFNVLGALLGRCGEARVSLPGGCSIGKRGIDLHLKGLAALGAEIELKNGYVEAKAAALHGAHINLDFPSVGATENIMLGAVLASGTTVISNAAQEPEIIDLANFLNYLGADVHGAGTSEITINGVAPEKLKGGSYSVVPDRIEAVTYMLMAAVRPGGSVLVKHCNPDHLSLVLDKMEEMGIRLTRVTPNQLLVEAPDRLKATHVLTQPYPGFPTDLQAPFMAALTVADGVSTLMETIYENRFKHVGELQRMGADVTVSNNVAVVTGVTSLCGAQVRAQDLRAGAAMLIAAMVAEGETAVGNVFHIDRGYESIEKKLSGLGVFVERHF